MKANRFGWEGKTWRKFHSGVEVFEKKWALPNPKAPVPEILKNPDHSRFKVPEGVIFPLRSPSFMNNTYSPDCEQ